MLRKDVDQEAADIAAAKAQIAAEGSVAVDATFDLLQLLLSPFDAAWHAQHA